MARFPDAYAFLTARQSEDLPVYVIGGRTERRVTLYSQQCRALNLVAALDSVYGEALAKTRVAVVGAGAAGMTAATALKRLEVKDVVVFDEAAAPLHPQRASFTRFLHPTLFHWPEVGWSDDEADLPVGGWRAGYADDVRNQILKTCGVVPVRYCTTVEAIRRARQDKIRLTLRRLGERRKQSEDFALAIIAAGFPSERPPAGASGGSYWHAIESLEDRADEDVHIIGDGDGALTEVLMLYIDLLGHRAVKMMAALLPDEEELRQHDLATQGEPAKHAETPRSVRTKALLDLLADLEPAKRTVTIHARNALKGGSFLLNRVFVEHLRWLESSSVKVAEADVNTDELGALGGTVIWRAGLRRARGMRPFETPKLSTRDALAALDREPAGTLDAVARGTLVQSIDALRRPLWSEEYAHAVRAAATEWTPEPPLTLTAVAARPSPRCTGALREIRATAKDLVDLGVPMRVDAIDRRRKVISIETIVRVLSIPHSECLEHASSATTAVRRDDQGRVWFAFPPVAADAGRPAVASRRAVAALVDPAGLTRWSLESRNNRERDKKLWADQKRRVHIETLRGLTDLSTVDLDVLRSTWRAHRERHEYNDAMRALLRRARVPSDNDPQFGDRTRRTLVDAARVIAVAPQVRWFEPPDLWVLLAAAAANLYAPGAKRPLVVSPSFLIGKWAPRTRSLTARESPPPWFAALTKLAETIPTSDRAERFTGDEVVVAATKALRGLPREARRPLARFGVRLQTV